MRSLKILLAAAVFALSACQKAPETTPAEADIDPALAEDVLAPPPEGATIEDMRAQSLAEIDRTACEAGGGAVVQAGMLGMWRCVTPYADAGKTCRDGDDCLGRCEFAGDVESETAPGSVTGLCQADDSPFGCFAEVEDGTATGFLCVD